MSDFLTTLAARALGVAPVLRPRTPALFEPAAAAPAEEAAESNRAAQRPHDARAAVGADAEPEASPAQRETALSVGRQNRRTAQRPAPATAPKPVSSDDDPHDDATRDAAALASVAIVPTAGSPSLSTTPPDQGSSFVDRRQSPAAKRVPAPGSSQAEPDVGRAGQTTENVVEITIGRVEIRAASPPTGRKATAPALTTLAEHLRQRNAPRAERGRA